jgi:hypothetical protein
MTVLVPMISGNVADNFRRAGKMASYNRPENRY